MIVVEGPDGSGKTTLIREIQSEFPVTLAPRVVSKDAEAMVDLVKWVEDDNAKLSQGVVYDRHRLISETIYGPVLRDSPQPGFDDIVWLEIQMRLFYGKKPTLIYCIPPWPVVAENAASLPASCTRSQAQDIYNLYVARAAVDVGCRRAVIYDYTLTPVRVLMSYINREEMF